MPSLMNSVLSQIAVCDTYMTKLSVTKAQLQQELSRIELIEFIRTSALASTSHFEASVCTQPSLGFFINWLFR